MKTIRRTDIFADWLKNLRDRAGAARIEIRIKRLAMGNPGQMRNLKGGVSEMKIDFGPGYRVYFTERNGELIVLLCGGDKKSQDKDIGRAVAMVGELEE
ncbi:type II toxin-antitoxin system RelE/ParE family toxin [Sphingobium yanoikuyae]|jgi:putative addiction module killer protein|uniref:Addiction module protein n=1 Tax=Sphingobium yanoikuyae TaxID=13690 RepID=A0A291N260_SPHYA|nr:type II toxin-antitoxin system RelE/ParE family toxin [Sphingobium yanoikuyae]ATI81449.1 addiction module protein [Sphingobium yanoikuyae]